MFSLVLNIFRAIPFFIGVWSLAYADSPEPLRLSPRPVVTFHHPTPRLLDGFGMSVSRHGSQIVVGAPNVVHHGRETGLTYLFDQTGNLLHTFEIPVIASGALFGQAVALSPQNIIIGAPHGRDEFKTQTGAVYLFGRKTNSHRLSLKNPHPISGVFGHALAVSDRRVLVGDPQASTETSFRSGAAYLFDETTGILTQTFRPEAVSMKRSTQFGHAVALVNDHVVISAPLGGAPGVEAGIVHLFDQQSGKLKRSFKPPDPVSGLLFGWAVAANTRVVLIGAFGFQGAYREQGLAYLFDIQTGKLLKRLNNPSPSERARFGKSVALFSDMLVVSAPGERIRESGKIEGGVVHLFDQTSGRVIRTLRNPLSLTGASDVFGDALFTEYNELLVGVPFGGIASELDAGLVYQFHLQ